MNHQSKCAIFCSFVQLPGYMWKYFYIHTADGHYITPLFDDGYDDDDNDNDNDDDDDDDNDDDDDDDDDDESLLYNHY